MPDVNIGSDSRFLPDGTKPLPDFSSVKSHFIFKENAEDIYPWNEYKNH